MLAARIILVIAVFNLAFLLFELALNILGQILPALGIGG